MGSLQVATANHGPGPARQWQHQLTIANALTVGLPTVGMLPGLQNKANRAQNCYQKLAAGSHYQPLVLPSTYQYPKTPCEYQQESCMEVARPVLHQTQIKASSAAFQQIAELLIFHREEFGQRPHYTASDEEP